MVNLLIAIIYLAFISLGLPDALLGSAWPTMYPQFDVPVSYAGMVSMIIAFGTVISSLMSDRLTRLLGTGKVTAISVGMTAVALFGFSFSSRFWMLCLWAIPYGLGAGSVDASLNNYVALHYESKHMSWLHCMWGIGATIGPYVMSYALTSGQTWNAGYRYIGFLQIGLTAILIFSLPLWKGRGEGLSQELTETIQKQQKTNREKTASPIERSDTTVLSDSPDTLKAMEPLEPSDAAVTATEGGAAAPAEASGHALGLLEILRISGAKEIMLCFFCYSAVEQTTNLWASSYMTLSRGMSEEIAAAFASMFFIGITLGRGACGFITMKLNDKQMIRMGQVIIALGVAALLLPGPNILTLAGFILVGLGCAPIYPCIIHSTPAHFGADLSQAIIGVQMASAYMGTTLMPPLFGLIANHITVSLLPLYLLFFLVLMILMHERLLRKTGEA